MFQVATKGPGEQRRADANSGYFCKSCSPQEAFPEFGILIRSGSCSGATQPQSSRTPGAPCMNCKRPPTATSYRTKQALRRSSESGTGPRPGGASGDLKLSREPALPAARECAASVGCALTESAQNVHGAQYSFQPPPK